MHLAHVLQVAVLEPLKIIGPCAHNEAHIQQQSCNARNTTVLNCYKEGSILLTVSSCTHCR